MKKPSKAMEKLSWMLYHEFGLSAEDSDFQIARGYWAQNRQDCIAWELNCRMAGKGLSPSYGKISIDSWDSISECAKKGIWLIEGSDGYSQYTAFAKSKHPNPPTADKFGHGDFIPPEQFKAKHQKEE